MPVARKVWFPIFVSMLAAFARFWMDTVGVLLVQGFFREDA